MSLTLQNHLSNLEKLATRNHDRACQHLADTRLKCNCGVELHNAKVIGTASRIEKMLKETAPATNGAAEPLPEEPKVALSQGVKVPQPIPGSPALQQPIKVQQPAMTYPETTVDIPSRTAGPAPEAIPPSPVDQTPRVQTPQEFAAMMNSDTPAPPVESEILPPMAMPTPPGAMELHAPPAPVVPKPTAKPPPRKPQRANA